MTLHKYLYCINNPINKLDPKGEFGESLYEEAEDAAASISFYNRMKDIVMSGATMANATFNGFWNVANGPESVGEKTLFAIGFASGAIEMQVGMRYGASAGGAVGSVFRTTLNQAFSDDTFLSWDTAAKIAGNAMIGYLSGSFAQWANEGEAVEKWMLFLISMDKNLITWDVMTYKKYFK